MSYKPIIFSTPMVQAILAGRKTMTRRVVKEDRRGEWAAVNGVRNNSEYGASVPCYLHRETAVDDISRNIMYPKYDVGDILWVRETWSTTDKCELYPPWPSTGEHFMHRADSPDCEAAKEARWFPSIHMPKDAARLFLRVTDVRAERVQEISDEDAIREGIVFTDFGMDANRGKISIDGGLTFHDLKPEKHAGYHTGNATTPGQCMHSARGAFISLWDTLNAKRGYGWDANPWVWVYTFERAERPAGWPGGEVSE